MSIQRYGFDYDGILETNGHGHLVRYDDHVSEVERLSADLATARAERDGLAKALWPCRNLLALMNGDGGHRQHEVGIEQAASEAEDKYTRMANALAALPTQGATQYDDGSQDPEFDPKEK